MYGLKWVTGVFGDRTGLVVLSSVVSLEIRRTKRQAPAACVVALSSLVGYRVTDRPGAGRCWLRASMPVVSSGVIRGGVGRRSRARDPITGIGVAVLGLRQMAVHVGDLSNQMALAACAVLTWRDRDVAVCDTDVDLARRRGGRALCGLSHLDWLVGINQSVGSKQKVTLWE